MMKLGVFWVTFMGSPFEDSTSIFDLCEKIAPESCSGVRFLREESGLCGSSGWTKKISSLDAGQNLTLELLKPLNREAADRLEDFFVQDKTYSKDCSVEFSKHRFWTSYPPVGSLCLELTSI